MTTETPQVTTVGPTPNAHAQLFSRVVTLSELAVGIGLLLGCLTGIAAA